MAFTLADTTLRDREYLKFQGGPTGSECPISVVIASGNITIGSVSATVDSIYVQSGVITNVESAWVRSGNVQPIADSVWGISGNNIPVSPIANSVFGVSGNNIPVSPIADSSFGISGTIAPFANSVFGISGTIAPFANSVFGISGLATIGSQASLYVVLCGVSGASVIPLQCTEGGFLFTSGA